MANGPDASLPARLEGGDTLPEQFEVSDEEARRVLSQFATTDPTVRKRVFSTLLRAISVGGG